MEDISGTIDTSFFSSKAIDYLFNYLNISIEGESTNIQLINSNSNYNNNNNNNNNDNNYNNNYNCNYNYNNNNNYYNNNIKNNDINNNDFSDNNINRKRRIKDDEDSDTQKLNIKKEILSKNKNINKKHKIFNIMTQCPSTYEEAMISKDSKEWNIAIKNEIKNMYDKNVMMVVNIKDIPKNTNIIDTRWVLVIKNNNTKKARLVEKVVSKK